MFKNNKLKVLFSFVIGVSVGTIATFVFTARLAGETETHATLTGLIRNVSTITFYMKKFHEADSICILQQDAETSISEINHLTSFLSERKLKFSGLNDFYVSNAQSAVDKYNSLALDKLNASCK